MARTAEDTPVTIAVAANNAYPDANLDPTTANTACAGCAHPVNSSFVNNGDGNFEYTPNLDFNGPDSFVYKICDTMGDCGTATASITVTRVADPPVANDDSATTAEDTPATIDVAASDIDRDGNLDPALANTACATCAHRPTEPWSTTAMAHSPTPRTRTSTAPTTWSMRSVTPSVPLTRPR